MGEGLTDGVPSPMGGGPTGGAPWSHEGCPVNAADRRASEFDQLLVQRRFLLIRGIDESVTCDQLRLDYEVTIDVATLEDAAWGSTRMSIAGLPQGEYVAVW